MNKNSGYTNSALNMRKVALTALAGTSIEWYDFFLYGAAAALIFPTAFFGEVNPSTALILSLLTFAAGFIARPIGGIIFGHFGDRIGRKKTLVIALILMGVASTLIGLLPTYSMIGVAAPIILTTLRFAQDWQLVVNGVEQCCLSLKVLLQIKEDFMVLMRKQVFQSE